MNSRLMKMVGPLTLALTLAACAKPRGETPQSLYQHWMGRVEAPVSVTVGQMTGIWERTGDIRLYRDSHDESYNDATGTTLEKSGDLLILVDGKAAKEYLRFGCPYKGEEPTFLFSGLNTQEAARSPALDLPGFLASLLANQPSAFAPFALEGQKVVTEQILRGPKPNKEKPAEFKPEPFDIKVITFISDRESAAPNLMQFAYQRKDVEFGVHTVIETYHRLEGTALLDRLKASKEAKPCTK